MCEQAAEALKSKGMLTKRSRISSDLGSSSRDSLTFDAMLSKKTSTLTQVYACCLNGILDGVSAIYAIT